MFALAFLQYTDGWQLLCPSTSFTVPVISEIHVGRSVANLCVFPSVTMIVAIYGNGHANQLESHLWAQNTRKRIFRNHATSNSTSAVRTTSVKLPL